MTPRRQPARKVGDAIWVVSDRTHADTYVATIHAGPDVTLPLNRDTAIAYAMTVLTACAHAEYDAALLRQFTAMDQERKAAGHAIADLRSVRAPLDAATTAPLRFEPIVSANNGKPFIHVYLDERPVSQWTTDDARGHAGYVLDAAIVVDLDGQYLAFLRDTVNAEPDAATVVVDDLGKWRQ